MKSFILFFYVLLFSNFGFSQDKMIEKSDMMVTSDSSKTCSHCYRNIISVGVKYYFNTLKNTRTTLAENGFTQDKEAFEYQIRLYNLPKVFYFQQLGNLVNTNYASVAGVGIKEDIRFPVFKNSNFIFTPYVELGAGYYRMSIAKGITSNSITSVLGSRVENYFIDNFVVSGDIGVDVGYGFNVDGRRISILLNGGFLGNFPTDWRLAGSLAFKEKIDLSSPYAGLTVKMDMNCSGKNSSCCK